MGWNTEQVQASPIFEPLRVHGDAVFDVAWPGLDDFRRLLERREPPVCVARGMPLRIVPQGRKPDSFQEKYEPRIYLRGELQVRRDNWHDYFNVLVWLAFPRAKAALNARQYAALEAQRAAGAPNRGPAQDALTLFDEGGVVVASADGELTQMLQAWRWKDLFWSRRKRLLDAMRFTLFGHALYEKALQPFPGITGRGVVLEVDTSWLAAPPRERLAQLDARLAAHLADPGLLQGTRELAVVPILGVPGWADGNESESFYDNTDYFRPGRLREKRGS